MTVTMTHDTEEEEDNYDENNDDENDNNEDDIYIMMQCLFVCHEKSSLPPGSLL